MPKPNPRVHEMCAAYVSGESSLSIARRFGLQPQTVVHHLRGSGIALRGFAIPPAQVDAEELTRIVSEAKLSIDETARCFGVSIPTITRRMRKLGLKSRKGRGSPMEKNFFWNGGRRTDRNRYVLLKIPTHPFATKSGYVREHRLVMEKVLGRYLTRKEVVHHIDSDKTNNDPSNLMLFASNAEHLLYEWQQNPNFSDPKEIQKLPRNLQRIALAQLSSIQKRTRSDADSLQLSDGRPELQLQKDQPPPFGTGMKPTPEPSLQGLALIR
jgi:DNA-binding CsgD family transcriptional regulator